MSNVAEIPQKSDGLAELAAKVKSLHAAVIDAGKNVVRNAISAGVALIEAKKQVGHGQWLKWLKENCELSDRTAEVYMTCARNRQRLEVIIATAANMTLSAALREIKPTSDKGKDGVLGQYEKAQTSLIKKLHRLEVDDVESAAQRTIAELNAVVASVRPAKAA
jgi:hypothetical protein